MIPGCHTVWQDFCYGSNEETSSLLCCYRPYPVFSPWTELHVLPVRLFLPSCMASAGQPNPCWLVLVNPTLACWLRCCPLCNNAPAQLQLSPECLRDSTEAVGRLLVFTSSFSQHLSAHHGWVLWYCALFGIAHAGTEACHGKGCIVLATLGLQSTREFCSTCIAVLQPVAAVVRLLLAVFA